MCIVADNVKDVSETKIASFHIAYSLDGGVSLLPGQLVVYAATVDSTAPTNAFILPVYNPGNDYKKIIPLDLSGEALFFDDLDRIYNRWFPQQQEVKFRSLSTNSYSLDSMLEVHRVGDYKFSIMPSKLDFYRVNRSELNINPCAKSAIDVHSNDYSFIVYQFYQKGKLEVSPFGYICEPHSEYSMIIPTIHGHPHDGISAMTGGGYGGSMYGSFGSDFEQNSDFDHIIYTLVKNPSRQPVPSADIRDINTMFRKICSDYMMRTLNIYTPKSFVPNKIMIKGYKSNRNIIVDPKKYTFMRDLVLDNKSISNPMPLTAY